MFVFHKVCSKIIDWFRWPIRKKTNKKLILITKDMNLTLFITKLNHNSIFSKNFLRQFFFVNFDEKHSYTDYNSQYSFLQDHSRSTTGRSALFCFLLLHWANSCIMNFWRTPVLWKSPTESPRVSGNHHKTVYCVLEYILANPLRWLVPTWKTARP